MANGLYEGAMFSCGLVTGESAAREEAVVSRARALGLGRDVPDLHEGYRRVARLDARDVSYFKDLMVGVASEVAGFAVAASHREARLAALDEALRGRERFGGIVGRSPAMRRLFSLLERVAESDATVLVTGENGTGKELIARAIHEGGARRSKPFVAQNCSALNDNLLESELFGHVRGAFTDATRDKPGLFQAADGGTFFLDEVGDMSPAMQVKLLRVLQEGAFTPVGGTSPVEVDVRIVAATNRPLEEMVKRREFREDLYYRLNVIHLVVPALRERLEDLPLLCEHFLSRLAERSGTAPKRLAPEVMQAFYESRWSGNIREL
jgi:transcriptional regulator with GAF, ATPase, and Fis domain